MEARLHSILAQQSALRAEIDGIKESSIEAESPVVLPVESAGLVPVKSPRRKPLKLLVRRRTADTPTVTRPVSPPPRRAHEAGHRIEALEHHLRLLYETAFSGSEWAVEEEAALRRTRDEFMHEKHLAEGDKIRTEAVFQSLDRAQRAFLLAFGRANNALGVATNDFQAHRGLADWGVRRENLLEAMVLLSTGARAYELAMDAEVELPPLPQKTITDGSCLAGGLEYIDGQSATPMTFKQGLRYLVKVQKAKKAEPLQQDVLLAQAAYSFTLLQTHKYIRKLQMARDRLEDANAKLDAVSAPLLAIRKQIVDDLTRDHGLQKYHVSRQASSTLANPKESLPDYAAVVPPRYSLPA